MDFIHGFVEVVLHLDKHLHDITANYGVWTYAILMLVVFAETGFVVTPFLPGDSLLFATGAVAASMGTLDVTLVFALLFVSAVAGNFSNYKIGRYLGPAVFNKKGSWFFNEEYLVSTQRYFTRFGGKTVVIGRFLPIVRTFAPFIAGIGRMETGKFVKYSVVGAILWVGFFLFAGFFFGNIPAVKRHFSTVILAIIFISILPAAFEFARHKYFPSEK
ncbi:MAG: DedA family protein [Nitrospinae bacterium]|nr:DedA family protein [Nitrospinota bacterium]